MKDSSQRQFLQIVFSQFLERGLKESPLREFVERAFAFKGHKIRWQGEGEDEIGIDQNGTIRVKINPKYYRHCEVYLLLGNAKKAEKELGWKREFDTLDTLI